MTSQSNVAPAAPLDAPAARSATRPLFWSVRRELWENRAIHVAPLAVAGVALFSFLISTLHSPARIRGLPAVDPAKQVAALARPYGFAASAVIFTTFVVAAFYCLDALHAERRDRSILFWKSLPVSDLTTVLSKAIVPFVVLPALGFAIALAAQVLMLLVSTAILLVSGISPAPLWTQLSLFPMSLVMLYGLAAHVLWFAPIYGWLLFVSGWARRAPFLWAVLPPLAVCLVEKMAFNTSSFASWLRYRFAGAMQEAFAVKPQKGAVAIDRLAQIDPLRFLSAPGLWIGLLVAGALLAAAVRLRRYREPI